MGPDLVTAEEETVHLLQSWQPPLDQESHAVSPLTLRILFAQAAFCCESNKLSWLEGQPSWFNQTSGVICHSPRDLLSEFSAFAQ